MKKNNLITLALVVVALVVMWVLVRTSAPAGPDAEAIARNNHGVGLMGKFDYSGALAVFEPLLEERPDWQDVQVNAAIALLNRQDEGDSEAALARLEAVLAADPDQLTARYCTGLLRLYLQSPEAAQPHFEMVAAADPTDAYASYYVGQCLAQQQEYAKAIDWLERARVADPYLRSAYYALQQAYRRVGREDEADAAQEAFFRLDGNPRARLVEFKYTRMGPRGEAIATDLAGAAPPVTPVGALFATATGVAADAPAMRAFADGRPAALNPGDLDGDGDLDVLVSAADGDDAGRTVVLLNSGEGGFTVASDHPLAGIPDARATLIGDVDNDGRNDVYVCRRGPNMLWRRTGENDWTHDSEAGVANDVYDTVDGAMVDADHDGDLDIFCVNADGPNELLNNDRDGGFRPLAGERGIAGDGRPSTQVLFADLDRDRDLDIVVINREPPHEVYLNDRMWDYQPAPGFDELRAASIAAAVAADLDADGTIGIVTASAGEDIQHWQPDDGGTWSVSARWPVAPGEASRVQLTAVDVDGDGTPEIVDAAGDGFRVRGGPGTDLLHESRLDPGLDGLAVVHLDPGRGPSVLGVLDDGTLQAWRPGPGRFAFAAMTFSGGDDPGQSMRSNASGIGAHLAARIESRWTITSTLRADSGPGQGLQPIEIGLGGAGQVDFVSIDWSDGVFQSEVALAANAVHHIPETQRQLSSCPVLFAWDGTRYRFISDVLGVGGIGFAVGPGEYAEPRPWERFLLPANTLASRDGRYALKLGEPMEEAMYLDAARLVAVDVPPGWSMTLDERFAIGGPAPTGVERFFRRVTRPVEAINDRGDDVLAAVTEVDHVAAPIGALDRRFVGRLAGDHAITLTFPSDLDDGPAPLLVADGWIEYPYSQTMFAAWQAGADYRAPTVEAQGRDGRWHVVLEQFGYPAGMPRQMSVPLPDLPAGTRRLRIATNQEIYWDALAVVFAEPCPEAVRHALPLAAADVRIVGFPRRIDRPQRRPDYDYADRTPLWDARHQAGAYTAVGPAMPLVAETDDAVAIIGPGEEVHLEFRMPPACPDGWTRRFVLETDGWCKDMDLYTADGETLGPLPGREPVAEGTRRLHERFNTRYRSGP